MGQRLTQEQLFDRGQRRCNACDRILSLEQFYKDAKGRGGYGYRCKPCSKRISRDHRSDNYETHRQTDKAYRSRPDIRARNRDVRLRRRYGIGAGEYDALLARQGGVCAVCYEDRRDSRDREMPVDHDHDSGAIRGILCDNCNRIIGLFQDDPRILRNAVRYLQRWAKRT